VNAPPARPGFGLRVALAADVPAIATLIPRSVRALQAAHYSPAQMDAALGTVFGVDHQLIADRTYFVAVDGPALVGCGGWSRRESLFGAGAAAVAAPALDPARDAARVRAFFVAPERARQGIGAALMAACERAMIGAGFRRAELVATLAGEPLYAAFGYAVQDRCAIMLGNGLPLPAVRMAKTLVPDARETQRT
jgi:predicted N-acetyltransferase YhbS